MRHTFLPLPLLLFIKYDDKITLFGSTGDTELEYDGVGAWKADCGSLKNGSSSSELGCSPDRPRCCENCSELPIDDADASLRADAVDMLRVEGIRTDVLIDGDLGKDIAAIWPVRELVVSMGEPGGRIPGVLSGDPLV